MSVAGQLEAAITAIRNFNLQLELKVLEEGYLGEVTNRHDDIFEGVSGSFETVPEGKDIFVLDQFLIERAQRKRDINASQVNATAKFNFPNGDAPVLLVPDMKFDPTSINTSGRDQYVAAPYSFKADTVKIILA